MDSSESGAVEETAVSATESQAESGDGSAAEISWGPIEYGRLRSVVAGGVAVVLVAVGVGVLLTIKGVVDSGSVPSEFLPVAVILLAGSWPFVVAFREIAREESAEGESTGVWDSLRRRLGWSWLRPGWVGVGAASAIGVSWLLGGTIAPYVLLPLLGGGLPLIFGLGRRYRLDPTAAAFEFESTHFDQTWSRSLEWLVGIRRIDLGAMSLFVCSNRGKRWYEGIHLLPVPAVLAPEVEAALRAVVDRTEPPQRIDRDVRIIVAGVGASMLGVGPLLYLLSGEAATLLIIAGPSALIAPGLLLHSCFG